MLISILAIVALAYVLGAIPCGVVVGRLWRGIDIMEYGSGKTGAANVQRTLGTKAAAVAAAGDLLKGAVAVYGARAIMGNESAIVGNMTVSTQGMQVIAALFAIIGHMRSVFIGFRGGRGVATYFGALLLLYWPIGLASGMLLLMITLGSRYFSLGSVIGAISSFVIMLVLVMEGQVPFSYLLYTVVGATLIVVQHSDNIRRLRDGTERRIGEKARRRASA